jgi:oligo-1,6-glucosidase
MSDVLDGISKKARDHARTPMQVRKYLTTQKRLDNCSPKYQWDVSPHAGFTTGNPWMRANDFADPWNVSAQIKDESSVLNFWKRALAIRKEHEVLVSPVHLFLSTILNIAHRYMETSTLYL